MRPHVYLQKHRLISVVKIVYQEQSGTNIPDQSQLVKMMGQKRMTVQSGEPQRIGRITTRWGGSEKEQYAGKRSIFVTNNQDPSIISIESLEAAKKADGNVVSDMFNAVTGSVDNVLDRLPRCENKDEP